MTFRPVITGFRANSRLTNRKETSCGRADWPLLVFFWSYGPPFASRYVRLEALRKLAFCKQTKQSNRFGHPKLRLAHQILLSSFKPRSCFLKPHSHNLLVAVNKWHGRINGRLTIMINQLKLFPPAPKLFTFVCCYGLKGWKWMETWKHWPIFQWSSETGFGKIAKTLV